MFAQIQKIAAAALIGVFACAAQAAQTLSLEELRNEVLQENLDIKIQYEKYYQSQKNVRDNLGEFLPNLSPQLLFWNTTYGVLYAVSPNPSSWFQYRGSNEMALAEKYVTESIKLNILRDLTLAYISVKHQERVMDSLLRQEPALAEAYEQALKREELGVGDANQTFLAKRKLMQHRQKILVLEDAIAVQKEGLMIALNREPSDVLDLAPLPEEGMILPPSVEQAVETGLANSPELVANSFMYEGAKYMSAAAKWSFISFSGIGFGYPAQLAIERSKAKEIELKRQKIANKISNQIALAYEQMDILDRRINLQQAIAAAAGESLDRASELHEGAQIPYADVLEAEEALFEEQRALVKLQMEKKLMIAKTKRLLGLDATKSRHDTRAFENSALVVQVDGGVFGKTKVSVNVEIPAELLDKVVSVVYGGDVFDYRIVNVSGDFGLYTRTSAKGEVLVKAQIFLKDGQKVELVKTVQI